MGIVFRQSIKTTIVIFTGAALGFLTNYFYSFMLLKQQFGFTRTLVNYGAIIQFLLLVGTGPLLSVFIGRYQPGDPRRKALLGGTMLIPLVAMAILILPYGLFQEPILRLFQPQDQLLFREYYWWIPPLILVWCYMTLFDSYLIACHKTAPASFAREVILRLGNIAVLLLFFNKIIPFYTFIASTVIVYLIPVLLQWYFAAQTEGFGVATNWQVFSKEEKKEIVRYSSFHWLTGATGFFMGFLDSIMLASLAKDGMNDVAIYTLPVYFSALVLIPYRAMILAAFPTLNRAYSEDKKEELYDLFNRSGINIWIVAVAMFLLIACNLHNAVAILPKGYEAVAPLTLILLIGKMIDMGTGLNESVIGLSRYYRFNFYMSLGVVLVLFCFNLVLIPKYGFYGAAWATTISFAVYNIAKALFLYRKLKLHPFSRGTYLTIIAGAAVYAVGYFLPAIQNPVADTAYRSSIVLVLYGLLILWLRPSADVQTYLRSIRENKRLF